MVVTPKVQHRVLLDAIRVRPPSRHEKVHCIMDLNMHPDVKGKAAKAMLASDIEEFFQIVLRVNWLVDLPNLQK